MYQYTRGREHLLSLCMRNAARRSLFFLGLLLIVTVLMCAKYKKPLQENVTATSSIISPADDASDSTWWRRYFCRKVRYGKDAIPLPVLHRDVEPSAEGTNIFMLEMSCNPRPLYRSWCGLESWALQNRRSGVWLVMLGTAVDSTDGLLLALKQTYPNLHVVTVDLEWLFRDLPTNNLFSSGQWVDSTWPAKSLSNMVRLAVVWHYGGFYADFDTVCLRPTEHLRNVVGSQSAEYVNNAIFHFDRHHPFVHQNMERQNMNFNGALLNVNGVNIMSNTAKMACNTTNFDELVAKGRGLCQGFRVLPQSAFYPVSWENWRDIFRSGAGPNLMKELNSSFVLHAWNVFSAANPVRVGTRTLYDLVSSAYCPITKRRVVDEARVWDSLY